MTYSTISIGKTASEYVAEGCAEYERRLRRYGSFEWRYLSDVKNAASLPPEILSEKEGESFLREISTTDTVMLLDAAGQHYTSPDFARFLQKIANTGTKRVCFLIGGAFGFSAPVQARAAGRISLSAMTFPHDLVRLIFVEQMYRAMTILRGEKYHHE